MVTIESLARTIAKARHGTDAHWANYVGAAEDASRHIAEVVAGKFLHNYKHDGGYPDRSEVLDAAIRSVTDLLAQPDGAQ